MKQESDTSRNGKMEVESGPTGDQHIKKDTDAPKRRHMSRWIKVPMWIIGLLLMVVIMIPVLLYVPPVQTAVKNLAVKIVREKTGMDISIEKFRLKFPVDVALEGVKVVEATGDTMVMAKEALADVKLLPLLKLDLQVKKLQLNDGYYRFVSPDSSMIIKIRAGLLKVDDKSSMNLKESKILINEANLADGDVSLYMNVWKQQPTPTDTTATPFYISARCLDVERIRFSMSMLPTIDTLTVVSEKLKLRDGIIDLATNKITASLMTLEGGDARYITPTPEYIAAHPVPASDTISSSPPMTIMADSISLNRFKALYAMKGAVPLPGFDANYISVEDVAIGMRNFYNQATTVKLPLTKVEAKERSGLQIVEGKGLVAVNEAGLALDSLRIKTLYSRAKVTADLPFALMELQPSAPVNAKIEASLGMPDINAFMPDLRQYTKLLPMQPLNALISAHGNLDDVEVEAFDVAMPSVFSLRANGHARNALDIKRLVASLDLDGELTNPSPIEKFAGDLPFSLPPLKISGKVGADYQTYSADISLVSPKGSLLADGHIGMTSEAYDIGLKVNRLNVAHFMPDLGVGEVTATLNAKGAGFNPTLPKAHTDIDVKVASVVYDHKLLRNITLTGLLAGNRYSVDLDSPNEDMNVNAHIVGTLNPDNYCAEGLLRIYNADLYAFGLMEETCYGSADLEFDVTARPNRWLYDATLDFHSISWHMTDLDIDLPQGIYADFIAEEDNVHCMLEARGTRAVFDSPRGLKEVTEGFTKAMDVAMRQIGERNLDVEEMQMLMPPFNLTANASGTGLLNDFLSASGMALDTVALSLANDSLIRGDVMARRLNTGSITLDTLTLNLKERGKLIDYAFHMGNRPGVMDEFAQANMNGYLGSNRLSAYVTQKNISGKTGYRIGFTAAFADSTVSLHFTPLKSTIAYLPWTFNEDNHIDYNFANRKVDANLRAASRESSLTLMTEPASSGYGDDLHLNISNVRIEDFLQMSLLAPPIKATVDGDVRVNYDGQQLTGDGTIGVHNLIYDKMMVGDFDLGVNAGVDLKGASVVNAGLEINGESAMALTAILKQEESGLEPERVTLSLVDFPLKIANPFLGKDVASVSGALNGNMEMTGRLTSPLLNGELSLDSVAVYLPIMASSLKFRTEPLTVKDNLITLKNFNIFGANNNPISINGNLDATKFSDISFDISANAQNFQLMNNDRRAKSDIYGKLFMNLNATVKGPMQHFDVNANLNVLSGTNATYTMAMDPTVALTNSGEVVKFVNFADTTQVAVADSVPQSVAMRMTAALTITPGAVLTVNLGTNGQVNLHPSGTLNAFRNFMGDMTVNGQLYLGEGFVNYSLPLMGQKEFTFNPESYVIFNGDMMNPRLNIKATDNIKASVVNSSGNSNLVNFLVGLNVTQTLSSPKVVFDLSTDDDLTLQNELQSMSPDQRSNQAMNLLLTGMYQGANLKTSTGNIADNLLYGFLESQLNSWAAKNIRGVDLSFGIDNYDKSVDGVSSNTMSYSYQVSKSLFNNRFKIVVGGNYSTDASADENFAQNLISDISFEYTLKQTNSLTMLVKLFRHIGYESVLEGEVTETGVGFVMKRRLGDLRRLFRVRWRRPKTSAQLVGEAISRGDSSVSDSEKIYEIRDKVKQRADSLRSEEEKKLPESTPSGGI